MPLNRALPTALLVLALSFAGQAQADELKDISQLANQGQQAAALDRINAYLSANPKDVQAMFIRGVILAEQGKRDDAIKAFTELTEKYPSLPEPYNNLAVLYADQGQYDKARNALETAIKTHPSYATAHENLGDIYARMASEAYDKTLQLDNGNTRAQNKLLLIKDLFSTGKPVLVANKSADNGKELAKEAGKPAPASPALPLKSAETIKPIEAARQVQSAKPTESAKALEPTKQAEPAKNIAANKSADPAKVVESKTESSKPADTDKEADGNEAVAAAVNEWARAWGAKNVDKYLASYADDFQAPTGESRHEWENNRRERINKPVSITVEVSNLQVKMQDASHAKASFKQNYRAGSLVKRTSKSLVLKKANGKWQTIEDKHDRIAYA